MSRRQQARMVDPWRAAKVALAIHWRVRPEDISDSRVEEELARVARSVRNPEEVVLWQR
jgi:uncharacterized protein YdaU (DUF1376 family)